MQKTLVFIDITTKTQVLLSGRDAKAQDYVNIERGQWQVLCIQFVERYTDAGGIMQMKAAAVPEGSLLLVGDSDFNDDDSLMFKSYQSTIPFDENNPESNRFNIEGDWISGELTDSGWVQGGHRLTISDIIDSLPEGVTLPEGTTIESLYPDGNVPVIPDYNADPSKGQLSIRINSDTAKFIEAIGNNQKTSKPVYINIKQYTSGLSNASTIAWLNIVGINTIRDWTVPTEEVPEGTKLTPFIDSYLRNPIEIEFSSNGTEWHTQQQPTDTLYHFRIANTSVTWSNPVRIINGKSVKVQYSEDNTSWHDTALSTDVFIRTSTDDGATWSVGMKIGLTADDIEAIKTTVTDDVKDHVQTELANQSW